MTQFHFDDRMKTIKKNYLKIDSKGEIDQFGQSKHIKKKNDKESIIMYFNVGYYLVIPILIGLGIGILVDRWAKTKPVFTVLLLLIGTMGSFYNLFTIQKK